ncbi:MAG: hypothetical protein EON85_14660 [Brevundimonas sp.]|nr:MAG: hypothetical protein EON85_14660 [Brevundimonas sp.]
MAYKLSPPIVLLKEPASFPSFELRYGFREGAHWFGVSYGHSFSDVYYEFTPSAPEGHRVFLDDRENLARAAAWIPDLVEQVRARPELTEAQVAELAEVQNVRDRVALLRSD